MMDIEPTKTTKGSYKVREFIKLTPELYRLCFKYMNQKQYTEKTKVQYVKELDELFKNEVLTQTLYNKNYQKGGSYRAILNLVLKTCWFNDLPYFNYKVIEASKSSQNKSLDRYGTIKIFSEDEIGQLADILEEYGLLVRCSYYIGGGLRFSSAIRLKWTDFNWSEWTDKNKPGKCLIHAKGKTEAYLPVHPILMNLLYNLAEENKKTFKGIPYENFDGENYIFLEESEIKKIIDRLKKEDNNRIIDNDLKKELKIDFKARALLEMTNIHYRKYQYQLVKVASVFKLKTIKTHTVRKSAATNLLRKGWPLIKIKYLLMHKSISTTEIYTKVTEDEINADYEKMIENDLNKI
jgi:integrase